MKILILSDLEGISGVSSIDDIFEADTPGYVNARVRLMADVNTAVRACFDAGATTVYAVDGHGNGKNFLPDALDPRAVHSHDLSGDLPRADAVVAIGMHAMAGTRNAFLDHTQSSRTIHHYFYNGVRIGELMQLGTYAGCFHVPCVAVSGDAAACAEARALFGEALAVACVKQATVRNRAECVDNETADRRIYAAVTEGLSRLGRIPPLRPSLPLEVAVEFNTTALCDEACQRDPSLERVDGYTVRSRKTRIQSYRDVLL